MHGDLQMSLGPKGLSGEPLINRRCQNVSMLFQSIQNEIWIDAKGD